MKFEHASGTFRLAGTLTLPEGDGPFPAVVLATGSGAQDRDEAMFGHRPFLVLADGLTRAGVAVLRYDDRGVGGSGTDGRLRDDTTADYATDLASGVAYLRTRAEIDTTRLGLLGHSEGGIVSAMVAAADPAIAFVVLLAAPGVPGDELLSLQTERIAKVRGADSAEAEATRRVQDGLARIIRDVPDADAGRDSARTFLRAEYDALPADYRKSLGERDNFVELHAAMVAQAWFRAFVVLDPRPVYARVRCPALALGGEKDLQVVASQNLPAVERALREGGNRDVTTKTMKGLNHLFQPAKTGSPEEYVTIEETFSPKALGEIVAWLGKRGFAPSPGRR